MPPGPKGVPYSAYGDTGTHPPTHHREKMIQWGTPSHPFTIIRPIHMCTLELGVRKPCVPRQLQKQGRYPHSCMMLEVTHIVPPSSPPLHPAPGTHTARGGASLGWLRLYLQKVFHSVSTNVNCKFTMTSTMAYWGCQMIRGVMGQHGPLSPLPTCQVALPHSVPGIGPGRP